MNVELECDNCNCKEWFMNGYTTSGVTLLILMKGLHLRLVY